MRMVFALLLLTVSSAAMAQTTYKCTDEQRRITYSNTSCEKQGLRDAGPVADRTTSMPFTEPPKKPAPGKPAAQGELPTTKLQPVNPLIEKAVK